MKRLKVIQEGSWMKWTLGVLGLFLVAGTAGFFTFYHSIHTATEDMHAPLDRNMSERRAEEVRLEDKDPFSVLMLGVDERADDPGRSDTMIVMTVNPTTERTKMLSIPRDTYTEIVGYGTKDKINHAYAYGGVAMAMNTVENMLDIPIDYYVKVNMEGFEDIIDVLGGVTLFNPFPFDAGGYHYPEGDLILNGKEALSYTRMREADPNGDFGRQERQRNVIQSVLREGVNLSTFLNYGDLLKALGNNIQTNLTFDQLMDIQQEYRQATETIEQTSLDGGADQYINGGYYYVIPEADIAAAQQMLKSELEL